MKGKKIITRRQFIKNTTAAAVGGSLLLGPSGFSFADEAKNTPSTAVLVRNKEVLDAQGAARLEVVQEMLDAAVLQLTNQTNILQAWKTLVKPNEIVGIKTNVWKYINTTPAVEQALKKRVMDAGVPAANIGIDDRGVLSNPIFKKADALINARPMRSHHWSGVGSLIKNYIMFVEEPWKYHENCADLAKLWQLPLVKGKTRLNVLVMFTPQFHGVGPHSFNPRYVGNYYGLLVGFDPVALDALGVRIIQGMRREYFGEEKPINPPPKHVFLADTRHHLGNADPNKIKLVKIGYDTGSFI